MTHDPFVDELVVARFTFKPERASEFIAEHSIYANGETIVSQPTVTQIECETVEEVMDYIVQFGDAILDCNAIVNGSVVTLSDYAEEA